MAEQHKDIMAETATSENTSTDKIKDKNLKRRIFYITPQKEDKRLKFLL